MKINKYWKDAIILIGLSYLCFMFGNGIISLTIPDEVFYAQTAKEMAQFNSWMTPYLFGQPQFEKPVMLYWLLRTGFILFGQTSSAARFFPALFGMIGVIAIYLLGLLGFKDRKKAFLSAVVLMTGGLYIGLSRTVFTDLIFSVFILLSLLAFYWGYVHRKSKAAGIYLFFIFSGLAALTKGPLGALIPFLTVTAFLLVKKEIKFFFSHHSLGGLFIFSAISLPWYMLMIKLYGNSFLHEFFYNDHYRRLIEAEHICNDRWYFYPLSMIGCIFPWSLFFLFSLAAIPRYLKEKENSFYKFLLCWIGVVFAVFQPAHSKLVSYIFPLFPAFAFFIGRFISGSLEQERGKQLFALAVFANIFFIFLIPLALAIATLKYSSYINTYIPSRWVVYLFMLFFLALGLSALFFAIRKKLLNCVYLFALFVPLILYLFPLVAKNVEPYLSTKNSCQYLLNNYKVNNIILSSKFFVRGVRFYTDKEVAVIDIPGTQFFSPHPVPFLNTDDKVAEFLRRQRITYGILKKGNFQDMKRICERGFKCQLLKVIGNEYIVRIESP